MQVKGILSYPHLFQARKVDEDSAPKYSVNVLLKEGDPQLDQVRAAIETAKANGFPSGFPASGKSCLKQSEQYNGWWEVRTSTNEDNRPHVVNAQLKPVMDPSKVYPGVIGWVDFNPYSYNKPMSKGIAGGLNGVLVTEEEGELGRLDNRPDAETMFSQVAGGTAASAPAPQAPAAPVAPAPAPQFTMTAAANGLTREAYHEAGWSDEQLIQHGMMLPPNGVTPSFMG